MHVRDNNFDALRFWAALAVLWSHSAPLSQGSERNELIFRWSGGQTTGGTLAVFVFFSISGFLIVRSYERAPTLWHYVRARVLRIMPALLVTLVITAFVIGPLATTLPLSSYFGSSDPYRYVTVQGSLLLGWMDSLPGVFAHNPLTAINGPVWTLRYEAECYGLVLLLGLSGLLRKEVTLALYVAALSFLLLVPGAPGTADALPDPNQRVQLGAAFLAGALIHQWKVPLDHRVAAACFALMAACLFSGQALWAQRTLLPYVTLYLAVGPTMVRLPRLTKSSDLSYGLYIWAWPISQLFMNAYPGLRWYALAALTTPPALLMGWLSWHVVEKRALAWKSRPLGALPATPLPRESDPEARPAAG